MASEPANQENKPTLPEPTVFDITLDVALVSATFILEGGNVIAWCELGILAARLAALSLRRRSRA